VFMDIEGISLGVDFRTKITSALQQSDVVIAIVGPQWLGPQATGGARIMDAADPVRIEIETALERKAVIIPVLVDRAKMPQEAELPTSLGQFAYLNAMQLDAGQDFNNHVNRLIAATDAVLGIAPAPSAVVTGAPGPQPAAAWQILLGYATVPTVVIVVMNYLVLYKTKLDNGYLEFVAIAVPLVAGFLLSRHARRGLATASVIGATTGVAAVLCTLVIVGALDGTNIIPSSSVEWTESLEQAASIALATIVGNALARAVPRGRAAVRRP